jgi:uncharacterized protein YkwD
MTHHASGHPPAVCVLLIAIGHSSSSGYNPKVPLRAVLTLLALSLLAACAVNPLTPTPQPQPSAQSLAVARVLVSTPITAPSPSSQVPEPTVEAPLSPTDASMEATATVAGASVIATQVEIVELKVEPTLPPPPPATQGPPPPTPIPPVLVAPPVSGDVAAAEQYCIDLINAQRAAAGLPPYQRDETVMSIARARVADMVARGYRGHNDPVTGVSLGPQMLKAAGFGWAGENWYGHRDGPVAIVDAAMAWFMTDPPHAQGILSAHFNFVGVGIAFNGSQWLLIQNFAGS